MPEYQKFLMLIDVPNGSEIAKKSVQVCGNLNDTATKELVEAHPNLEGADCEAKLTHHASNIWTDQSEIEVLNGRLRKDAVSRVNTHKIAVADLDALWAAREHACDKPSEVEAVRVKALGESTISKKTSGQKMMPRLRKVRKASVPSRGKGYSC